MTETKLQPDAPKEVFQSWMASLPTAEARPSDEDEASDKREKVWRDEGGGPPAGADDPSTREKVWLDEGGGPVKT